MEVIKVAWKIFRYHHDCLNKLIRVLESTEDLYVKIFQKDDRSPINGSDNDQNKELQGC